jgi:hypothetical protein
MLEYIIETENSRRADGSTLCPPLVCPDECPPCPESKNCGDIILEVEDLLYTFDSNNDYNIDLGDEITGSELSLLLEECDAYGDDNGTVSVCELWDCRVRIENESRVAKECDTLHCERPDYPCCNCPGSWSCD